MKKTLIISSYDDLKNPYYGGGGATAVHSVAKRLVDHYQVVVLTGNYPGAKNESLDGVKYVRLGLANLGPRLSQTLFQLCLICQVVTRPFDLWIESFTPPFSTSFLPLFTARPVIGLVHMLSAKDMERKYKLPFRWIENIGLKLYRHFIVLSEGSKKEIKLQNNHADFLISPNGVDLPQSKGSTTKPDTILFLGRIEINQKGLDLLLSSFTQLATKTKLSLTIAGTGTDAELKTLEQLLSNHPFATRINYLGKVTGHKKQALLNRAFVTVIPSRYETFSLTALEAIAYRSPIVCFDIDGMKWLSKEIALKATPFSSSDFAHKLSSLISDVSLRTKMIKAGSLEIKKYDWDLVAKNYLAFIRKCL